MGTLRQFLDFCEDIEAISVGISEVLRPINLDDEDEVDKTMLSAEKAAAIRSYLHGNAFATFPHVIFEIFWHTGMRLSTIRALDVEDFHTNRRHIPSMADLLSGADRPEIECYFGIADRPETETDLKNDSKSEREVTLSPEVAEVVDGWLKLHHPMVKDDHGRMPLIGTQYGRASKSAVRENIYRLTRPCHYADACPDDRDLSCDRRKSKEASKCPFSVSPHPIRKGSITYHRNSGWLTKAVSDRADVSREVLELHYDMGSETEKRKRREKFLDRL